MELTPFIDDLRQEFLLAAEARGAEAMALATGLVAPLDSSVRLALLGVLSAASSEITRDLAPGSVEIRLRDLDPHFVVTPPPAELSAASVDDTTMGAFAPRATEEGAAARINFRPPEELKARIEEAAGREGISVNAWLVRTAAAALRRGASSERPAPPGNGQHVSGWAR